MTNEDAKKELMVVHRDSPIGETHEHFYSVSSVNKLIERLVGRINELLRWRNSLKELPEHRQIVLVKLAEDCFDVCMYDIYLGMFIGIEDRYKSSNTYDWRPIIDEE